MTGSLPEHLGPHRGGVDFAANTNVVGHAGRTLALVEGGARPYELNDELDTVGPSYSPFWGNRVRYTVTGVDGRVRRTVPIEVGGRPMMHDFVLTEQHVVCSTCR